MEGVGCVCEEEEEEGEIRKAGQYMLQKRKKTFLCVGGRRVLKKCPEDYCNSVKAYMACTVKTRKENLKMNVPRKTHSKRKRPKKKGRNNIHTSLTKR